MIHTVAKFKEESSLPGQRGEMELLLNESSFSSENWRGSVIDSCNNAADNTGGLLPLNCVLKMGEQQVLCYLCSTTTYKTPVYIPRDTTYSP